MLIYMRLAGRARCLAHTQPSLRPTPPLRSFRFSLTVLAVFFYFVRTRVQTRLTRTLSNAEDMRQQRKYERLHRHCELFAFPRVNLAVYTVVVLVILRDSS